MKSTYCIVTTTRDQYVLFADQVVPRPNIYNALAADLSSDRGYDEGLRLHKATGWEVYAHAKAAPTLHRSLPKLGQTLVKQCH